MSIHIQLIRNAGFRVFVRPSRAEPTYCFFTDGTRIGYAQWDTMREHVSSVHKSNRVTGSGFQVADRITPETLNAAASCIAPHWASSRDRASVVKYRDFDAYLKESAWNSGLVEVTE